MTTADKDIRYSITAEDRFSRAFGQLKRDISGSRDQFDGLISKAGLVNVALGSIALGAVGAGGLLLGIRQLTNDLDKLNDAADATGASIEGLSALENVSRRNGAGLELVVTAALKLNKVLTEATPDSAMAQTLQRIGLDAAALRKVDPSEAVRQVAVALSGFADDGNKARLVQELFGKSTKEVAAFLKDLADAGQLNVKVTTEQAQAAEKLNKEIYALQTNSYDAARALTSKLIPALNTLFREVKEGGVSKALGLDDFDGKVQQAVSAYRLIGLARERITPLSILEKNPTNAQALAELARIDELAKQIGKNFSTARTKYLGLTDSGAGAGRGFVNPPLALASVGAAPVAASKPQAARVSEAMRYLEQLQKQGEKLQDLTVYQQLLADIEAKRIDGITPKLEKELKLAAQRVDLQKQLNVEKEREAGFQKILGDKTQRDIDEVLRLLDQTTSGRLQGLENQADKLLTFSRSISEDDPRQRQVLDAMKRLNKEAKDLASPASAAATEFDKLADAIEKSMDRATSAVLDFVIEGKGSITDLGKAFARDVLRSLIEDPMRDTMKAVGKSIRQALSGDDAADGILGFIKSLGGGGGGGGGSGSGGGIGDFLSAIGGFFGFTGRANGGSVNAGQMVRWQENGREWFVPGADGAVVNQAQMRGLGGGGGLQQTNHITIQGGGDPAEVQRQINAALARNNAALVRSMRLGGAMAS